MLKSNSLGYAIYPSNFVQLKDKLSLIGDQESFVFTSLHIQEEMKSPEYGTQVQTMLSYLQRHSIKVIADISKRTLEYFNTSSIVNLVDTLKLDAVRLDFGFTSNEIVDASNHVMIVINASMFDEQLLNDVKDSKFPIVAMHNFYPREYTGLDIQQFLDKNIKLRSSNIKIAAFIPGDDTLRGPIFAGLPTLEHHRKMSPYASFVQCKKEYDVDYVFVGDGIISVKEKKRIDSFNQESIILLKSTINTKNTHLFNQVFTIRNDSPKDVLRLFESRTMASQGQIIEPENFNIRSFGSICMDNKNYLRYSGEVQLLRCSLPQDDRVNVVGHVNKNDYEVLHLIKNNDKIMLIEDEENGN